VSGERVLVVDDHAGFRAAASRILQADGWQIAGEAADGASALAAAARLRPDVVLLDIGLPDIDGFAVTARLSESGGPSVVLVSSRDRAAYGDRIELSSAIGFLTKGDLDGVRLRRLLGDAGDREVNS
jgi:DNA-binding NarL/FixJ family response regulator